MHLDGLADTADGLGSYAEPDRALAIMREGPVGPFGVVALVLVLGAQAAAIGDWPALRRSPSSPAGSRSCCAATASRPPGRTGSARSSPARQPRCRAGLLAGRALLLSPLADVDRPYLGPVAIVVATGLVLLLCQHVRRRLGGITGDVLGAASELATTAVLVVLSA